MNVSEIKVKLLGNDVLSIINEFVKIEGLIIRNVIMDEGITLEGSFKKALNIDFLVKVELINCRDNKLVARIIKIKIMNMGMFRILRSFAIKQLAKAFSKYGIYSDKDKVIININTLLKDIPFVDLNVEEIYMKRSELWVEASDLRISIAGKLIKKIEAAEEVVEEKEEEINELEAINKVEDNYSRGRKILGGKLSENTQRYKEYIFILPDIVSLIYRLLKDKRVPIKTKLVMTAAITYITLSTDIIPNNIPFIGVVDDIGVAFFAINKVLDDVPLSVIVENWQGKNELLLVLKKGFDYLVNFTAAKNVEKLYGVIEELSTL